MICKILSIICKASSGPRGWPLGRSLVYSPGGGVQISPFDICCTLIEVATSLFPLDLEDDEVFTASDRVLSDVLKSVVNTYSRGSEVSGWCNDFTFGHDIVESWTTALVIDFLKGLRGYGQERLNRSVLQSFDTSWSRSEPAWLNWDQIDEPEPERGILDYIKANFSASLERSPDGSLLSSPSKRLKNVSMILFGPPGTSKTTLAKALAKDLDWPLVSITPSLFLSKGREGIDASASSVFGQLAMLQHVVILFDECEELFRKRPSGLDLAEPSLTSLITGAMLPRLQELHDRGGLIVVIATNHMEHLDPGVIREGRIDHKIAVGPPSEIARRNKLAATATQLEREAVNRLAGEMKRFSWSEVDSAVKFLRDKVSEGTSSVDDLLNNLRARFPKESLSISEEDLKSYEEQKKRFNQVPLVAA